MNELSFVMRQPELFEGERGVDMKMDYVDDKVMDSMFRMADKKEKVPNCVGRSSETAKAHRG
eukprot:TRINITY_DN3260_c0_g1_i1.p3 TRINITY_DN3260_c0_g1~~TRINITY_DN3260_c0_g1_i1.p3  ORF type:complete len:62 (+),score=32.59 TRINITY_DN3260_c0_g1_i1:670-855(+)